MHTRTLHQWQHEHDFSLIHEKGENRTLQVLALTAVTMVIEIAAGVVFGSMALLADGWHMGTHAAAFLITIFAYRYTRRHAMDRRFTFGTGKVSVLGGFASAVALAVVALVMAAESFQRFFAPLAIRFDEAIAVAVLGLVVNLVSAFLLQDHRDDEHEHGHVHDHNLRGAYLHVLADALTSVLAIAALTLGKFFGWHWLDPAMGIVGAVVITRWSYGLMRDTSSILLDRSDDTEGLESVKEAIERDRDNRVPDIHVWRVGPRDLAAIVSVVTHYPRNPVYYKSLLKEFEELAHVTVEVNACDGEPCIPIEGKPQQGNMST